ncbi:molybdate-anion transporter-like [Clavelina lepadiformis]|uniref:Molybdate-anion transporter n=1 Tax=Clavelina lepadiformis TaxID=159417 RepID=A0ABP0GHC7_CLALP
MDMFWLSFWILLVICIVMYIYTRKVAEIPESSAFKMFQKQYLVVYLLAMGGDWLQGPYVYALYQHYGMTTHQIDVLFVAGFGSSMIFGTFVGSSADKMGRRFTCIVYAVLYSLACITKHFPVFWILLVGRFLGGIATSILFSAFESWLVCEYHKRDFGQDLLGELFSRATLGNSLVAISAGHLAQVFADMYGFVAPFDVSMTVLVVMVLAITLMWKENHGDAESTFSTNFKNALTITLKDPKIMMLGVVQSFFEGSMYTFVLEWTPALTPQSSDVISKPTIPHGLIFASFMVAVMIGSSVFKLASRFFSIESFMRFVLLTSASSLAIPVFFPENHLWILLGFFVFEVCVGIFWPSLGTMRSIYVPESVRSTVMNYFRIPLNLIVIVILLQDLSLKTIFSCCVIFLLLATVAQHMLFRLVSKGETNAALPLYHEEGSDLISKDEQNSD